METYLLDMERITVGFTPQSYIFYECAKKTVKKKAAKKIFINSVRIKSLSKFFVGWTKPFALGGVTESHEQAEQRSGFLALLINIAMAVLE